MNTTNKVLMLILLVMIPFAVLAASQDDGRTYFTVNQFCANTDNAVTNEYATGQMSVSLTDGLYVKSEAYDDDGAYYEYAISTGYINDVVTVNTALPVIGDGSVGDPIDISTAIAGYGLSMTTNIIDVNTGSGLYIDGDNVVAGWSDRASHIMSLDVATLAADTTYTWPDVPVANGYVITVDTDGAMHFVAASTLPGGSPPGANTQVAYNAAGEWGAEAALAYDYLTNLFTINSPPAAVEALNLAVNNAIGVSDSVYVGDILWLGNDGMGTTAQGFFYTYEGASAGADVAGYGQWWNRSDAPCTPMYTDDAGNDFQLNANVDSYIGYNAGEVIGISDGYIYIDTVGAKQFAGTGVNDGLGFGIPWDVSIVGIAAQYKLSDADDVVTIDVFPYADGNTIGAACKLTLAETGANRDAISETFPAGSHTASANETLGIYIDVIGDTNSNATLTDLIVTVHYHFSL